MCETISNHPRSYSDAGFTACTHANGKSLFLIAVNVILHPHLYENLHTDYLTMHLIKDLRTLRVFLLIKTISLLLKSY